MRRISKAAGALAICAAALCTGAGTASADSWYWFWTTAGDANPRTVEYCKQNAQRALATLGNSVQTPKLNLSVEAYAAVWSSGSADLFCMPVDRGMYVTLVIRSTQNDSYDTGKRFEQTFWGDAANTNIAGTWYRDGDRNKPVSIRVDGNQLSLTNEFGTSSRGHMADASTVVADDWEGGLRGTVSADGRRIDWANNTSWAR